jgi:hypothetical protein
MGLFWCPVDSAFWQVSRINLHQPPANSSSDSRLNIANTIVLAGDQATG